MEHTLLQPLWYSMERRRGKARMVINYKNLNQFTRADNYFLPNKEVLINLVKNKKFFSKFDCKSGFWQIKMEETSIKYTGFSTPLLLKVFMNGLLCILD